MKVPVKRIKNILHNALVRLEDYDDDVQVDLESNTYFVKGCHAFLGISGSDGGYIALDRIDEIIDEAMADDEGLDEELYESVIRRG